MSLAFCPACARHHDPATACPFCADAAAEPVSLQLGGALLLSAAAALGCVGPNVTPAPPARPALIDSLPTPTPGPTTTPTPETTYGMPAPRRRRRPD